jgi:hypothetical protein
MLIDEMSKDFQRDRKNPDFLLLGEFRLRRTKLRQLSFNKIV